MMASTLGCGAGRPSGKPSQGEGVEDFPTPQSQSRMVEGVGLAPPCILGASQQGCHGWASTATGGPVPFVKSMTCTYSVPEIPVAIADGNPPTVLYLYCQVVGGAATGTLSPSVFGQMAPQIAIGADFDTCGQTRPSGPIQWYMQAMYFWDSNGKPQCLGGPIFPVSIGASVTSVIEWDTANQLWLLSITDGTNTSSQSVKAPSDPTGSLQEHQWSDFTSIRPGASFEIWNGVSTGSYPLNEWQLQTTFEQSSVPIAPLLLQMIPKASDSNAMSVACSSTSLCTWEPPK